MNSVEKKKKKAKNNYMRIKRLGEKEYYIKGTYESKY